MSNKYEIYHKGKKASLDDIVHQENAEVSSNDVDHNIETIKMLLISLTKLHFQTRVIQFKNVFIYNYDIKMLREKIKETYVSSSNKWKVSNTMSLCHILRLSAGAPFWKEACKKVNNFSIRKVVYQFQVVGVSYLNLRQNNVFRDKIDNCLSQQLDVKMSQQIRRTLKQESTFIIALIMLYENRKSLILKVLGVVVCCFIEKYVCVDYLSLQGELKSSSLHRGFEDTSFNEISAIGTPYILLNIVSCYSFDQDNNSTLILACRSKSVSYYFSKGF